MGAIGASMLAREAIQASGAPTQFRGFAASAVSCRTNSFECRFCSNRCEIVQVLISRKVAARWGGRCDRWDMHGAALAHPWKPPRPTARRVARSFCPCLIRGGNCVKSNSDLH